MSRPLLFAAVLMTFVAAAPAYGQESPAESDQSAPANLAYVDGGVEVVHEGVVERADPPLMLVEGDIVRTRSGRAEIVFADGSLLHLDYDAELEILAPERIRLMRGRTLIRISVAADRPYVLDTPAAIVRLASSGEYEITAGIRGDSVDVMVARGSAEIDDGSTRATLRSGQMVSLAAGARPLYQPFNSARLDAFAQWASDRTRGFAGSASAAQLPSELRPYGPVLDHYGRWDYVAPHGYVWFPSVGVAWRPYYDGWWGHTRYGWTWHGRDRWAWPTHHYGRWGYNGSFWFWIPARVWGPAYVSWGAAAGFVSWCPLGWDNRPVFGYAGYYGGYPYDPWRSWTVIPRNAFGYRRLVRLHAVDASRLDAPTRTALFAPTRPLDFAPTRPLDTAVPRGATSVAGGRGSARGTDSNFPRRGEVRRPATPETDQTPAQPAVIDHTNRGNRDTGVAGGWPMPDPRNVPEARPEGTEGRGAARRYREPPPDSAGDSAARDQDRGTRSGRVREAQPRQDPPPQYGERASNPEGARRRGDQGAGQQGGRQDGARQESARRTGGAQERGGARAPAAAPPSGGGGAVRRRP